MLISFDFDNTICENRYVFPDTDHELELCLGYTIEFQPVSKPIKQLIQDLSAKNDICLVTSRTEKSREGVEHYLNENNILQYFNKGLYFAGQQGGKGQKLIDLKVNIHYDDDERMCRLARYNITIRIIDCITAEIKFETNYEEYIKEQERRKKELQKRLSNFRNQNE